MELICQLMAGAPVICRGDANYEGWPCTGVLLNRFDF